MNTKWDNTKVEDFRGVWVFCEQRFGRLMPTDFELLSEGRKLADELGTELCGLLLGDDVDGIARELGGYGADRVLVCSHPLLHNYTTDAYAKAVCDIVMERKPEILLFGATNIGRDLAPRIAAPPSHRAHSRLHASGCRHAQIHGVPGREFNAEFSRNEV